MGQSHINGSKISRSLNESMTLNDHMQIISHQESRAKDVAAQICPSTV